MAVACRAGNQQASNPVNRPLMGIVNTELNENMELARGRTSRWPRTRPNLGLCTRQNAAPWLRYLKLASFTTATSGAPPERNSPRHDSYAGSVPILVARHRQDLFLIAHPTVDFWCLSICLWRISGSYIWIAGQCAGWDLRWAQAAESIRGRARRPFSGEHAAGTNSNRALLHQCSGELAVHGRQAAPARLQRFTPQDPSFCERPSVVVGRNYCIFRSGETTKAAPSLASAVPALTIRAASSQNGPTGVWAYFLRA